MHFILKCHFFFSKPKKLKKQKIKNFMITITLRNIVWLSYVYISSSYLRFKKLGFHVNLLLRKYKFSKFYTQSQIHTNCRANLPHYADFPPGLFCLKLFFLNKYLKHVLSQIKLNILFFKQFKTNV